MVLGINNNESAKHWMLLIDDINSQNIEYIKSKLENCTLQINTKFPMPLNNNDINIDKSSKSIKSILDRLNIMIGREDSAGWVGVKFVNDTQYKNLSTKIKFWLSDLFKDVIKDLDKYKTPVVYINNDNISKHEWLFITLLFLVGVSFLIVSNKIDSLDISTLSPHNITVKKYGTTEHLKMDNVSLTAITNDKYKTLDDVEKAIYDNNENLKINIIGIDNIIDTSNFYAKLKKKCENSNQFMLVNGGFKNPSYEYTSKIPRIPRDDHFYLTQMIPQYLNLDNQVRIHFKYAIEHEFNKEEYRNCNGNIFYNKLVRVVSIINQLFNESIPKYLVYYGKVNKGDAIILSILNNVPEISLIIMCPDKSIAFRLDNIYELELESSTEIFEIPSRDTRDDAVTMASQAENRVNQVLYNGDTLGMYRPGQFKKCKVKHFNTTYEEIAMWWNREMYIRPGFEVQNDTAIIPTIFKVIKGVNNPREYLESIQKLSCGKTFLCKQAGDLLKLIDYSGMHIHNCTDINGTTFDKQKPFFEHRKLRRDRITSDKNYKYAYLDKYKQDLILDKIEDLLNGDYINDNIMSNSTFIDNVLTTLLNLKGELLRCIQWFEFYNYNPNVIMTLTNENTIREEEMILLVFLRLIGFDILVYVPTCYTSIERFNGNGLAYDEHIIGEANYDINTSNIIVTSNIQVAEEEKQPKKKQGFFSKLFG